MKMTLDFDAPQMMQLTTSDDTENYYTLIWNLDKKFSLWFNGDFVWETRYEDLSLAIGAVIGIILEAMMKNNQKQEERKI